MEKRRETKRPFEKKKRPYDWRKDSRYNLMSLGVLLRSLYRCCEDNFINHEDRDLLKRAIANSLLEYACQSGDKETTLQWIESLMTPTNTPITIDPVLNKGKIEDHLDLFKTKEWMSLFDWRSESDLERINHVMNYKKLEILKEKKFIKFLIKAYHMPVRES